MCQRSTQSFWKQHEVVFGLEFPLFSLHPAGLSSLNPGASWWSPDGNLGDLGGMSIAFTSCVLELSWLPGVSSCFIMFCHVSSGKTQPPLWHPSWHWDNWCPSTCSLPSWGSPERKCRRWIPKLGRLELYERGIEHVLNWKMAHVVR